MSTSYTPTPSPSELEAELRTKLPGLDWQVSGEPDSHTVTLRARRRVEYLDTKADEMNLHADSAAHVIHELVRRAQDKAIEDYGLKSVIAEEREQAARRARIELLAELRNEINQYREPIEALDENGAIVMVRGPLPYWLEDLYVWASGVKA